jgi:tetratricopeptide (TPR) repeat protein
MSVQQVTPQQRSWRKRGSRGRILIFVACSLLTVASVSATAFQFLSPLVGSVLTALPILIALATYLFPLPPVMNTAPETTSLPQPIQLSVTVQAPSASPSPTDQQTNQQTIWNVPYRRNPYFTGREEVLQHLHDRLRGTNAAALTQSQAISGLGGIGKTQIAVEYAYRHQEEYQGVLWVNAASRETIMASFLELANLLELPEHQEADQNKIVTAVRRWLTTHNYWLLIFDNADELTLTEEFLPASNTGSLLLTTRNQSVGTLAESLDIQIMEKEEGMLLVLRRAKLLAKEKSLDQAKPDERTLAERIVQKMDGLPLALDQAAAYIEETGCTLSAFLENYQRQRADILRRRGGTGKEHPLPAATTWSLSFAQVEQLNPAAADLLRVCAFFAPDAIPEEMIVDGANELGPLLARLKDDATQLDEMMETLNRFSLMRRNREDRTLSLHRLVQDAQIMDMDKRTRKRWVEQAVRAVNQAFPSVEFTTWSQCERYLAHALQCLTLIETYALTIPDAAYLLHQTGRYLYERAQYQDALRLYQHALSIKQKALGPEHPSTATTLHELASLYQAQGRYDEAEPLYQHALSIYQKALGPEHPSTAATLNNLATLYQSQRKYEQAAPLLKRALVIMEKVPGPNHPNTKTVRSNYAGLLEEMKRKKRSS